MSDIYSRDEGLERGATTMALTSMWTGIASLACIALMFCTCYASLFAAFPLGLVSLFTGFQTLSHPGAPMLAKQMAAGGIVSASISTLISLAFGAFIMLYMAMIVLAGVVGSM